MAENEEKIERLYAFLSIDAKGFNGVVAGIMPGIGATPLVTSKRSIAKAMIPAAQEAADRNGVKVGLFLFKRDGDDHWMSE